MGLWAADNVAGNQITSECLHINQTAELFSIHQQPLAFFLFFFSFCPVAANNWSARSRSVSRRNDMLSANKRGVCKRRSQDEKRLWLMDGTLLTSYRLRLCARSYKKLWPDIKTSIKKTGCSLFFYGPPLFQDSVFLSPLPLWLLGKLVLAWILLYWCINLIDCKNCTAKVGIFFYFFIYIKEKKNK